MSKWSVGLAAAWLGATLAAQAAPFVPVWIDGEAKLPADTVESVTRQAAADGKAPDDIVLWVHGLNTTRDDSQAQYTELSQRMEKAFAAHGRQVSNIGVQWDSPLTGLIFAIPGQYEQKTRLARRVGRYGLRQVLLGLQDRYPQSRIHVMTHSLGSEVYLAAVRPGLQYAEWDESERAVFQPERTPLIFATVWAGSDLDYNITAQEAALPTAEELKLLWMTQSSLFRKDQRDSVLDLRAFLRGRAWGSTFPMMSEKQYDAVLGRRTLVLDNERIPRDHAFLKYYDDTRVQHVADAILYVADPQHATPPPEIAGINEVMAAPDTEEALIPFLDAPQLSQKTYALWRLECRTGTGAKNFASGYLPHLNDVTFRTPRRVAGLRADSPSHAVRQGEYPTDRQLERSGLPPWGDHAGSATGKCYGGEVTAFDGHWLEVATDDFQDPLTLEVSRTTRFTPDRETLRVGSKVRLQCDSGKALSVTALPLSTWLRQHPPAHTQPGPRHTSP